MSRITTQDNNIHSKSKSRNSSLLVVKDSVLGPRVDGDGRIRQFSDISLRDEFMGCKPFSSLIIQTSYYDDLQDVRIIKRDEAHGLADKYRESIQISHDDSLLVPRDSIRRHGELAFVIIGRLLIGQYYYSVDLPNRINSSLAYTLYERAYHDSGTLEVIKYDSMLEEKNRAKRPADQIDFSFVKLAVLVMMAMDLGYQVDENKVRSGDKDVVVDENADEGYSIIDADDCSIPLVDVPAVMDEEFIDHVDDLMRGKVFASDKDYANFCMAVFYSVMGLHGAHYFIMTDSGGSGKTTLMNGLARFVPTITTTGLQLENLAGTGFEHGMAVTQLEGKKIAIQDEVINIKPRDMRVLNAVSSGTKMDARYGSSVFKYVNVRLSLWFAGNTDVDLPDIDAVRRRRIDIQLLNQMDHAEWSSKIGWDPKHRQLHDLVQSVDVFSVMFKNGMRLWRDRRGEFFEIIRGTRSIGDQDSGVSSNVLHKAEIVASEYPVLTDEIVSIDCSHGENVVLKTENMIGKPRDLVDFVKSNGFSLKSTTFNTVIDGETKKQHARWLVVEDVEAVLRLQRLLSAVRWLADNNVSASILKNSAVAMIMAGQKTIKDYVEIVEARQSNDDPVYTCEHHVDGRLVPPTGRELLPVKQYCLVDASSSRPDLAKMLRDQYNVAPVAVMNGFVKQINFEAEKVNKHEPFMSTVPWSLIESFDDGEKWARAVGLKKFVDPETGETWAGSLDAIDAKDSTMQIGWKFPTYWH